MRILFVADGRSPIALNWIGHFAERADVYLASTFACAAPPAALKGMDILPVAFSGVKRAGASARADALGLRTALRQWFGPLTLRSAARQLRAVVERVQPDLIHALRIPYEGMLAAEAATGVPLLISVWGNDFTLHARSTPLMARYTRRTLRAADALHADCERDLRLARQWGLGERKPTLVIPGNGGVRTEIFHPPARPVDSPVVINPRGFRAYVRNDAFFKAIPLVLEKHPGARFLCASMDGQPRAIRWREALGVESAVELLQPVPHAGMGNLFRMAQIVVSPAVHDGTPNSLLEGMACGCFPVAGDLESIREWIRHGENGLLTDPTDPRALADAILVALENIDLRTKAAGLNHAIILSRAEFKRCMREAEEFYEGMGKR